MPMTQTQRNEAIAKLLQRRTVEVTASREIARKTLIREGIYTSDGKLSAEYGGAKRKKKANAA